jgi:hypothetical protein
MNKIILEFDQVKFDNQNAKFNKAVTTAESIENEFSKINLDADLLQLLDSQDMTAYCIDAFWIKANKDFPKTVTPINALKLTDFNISTVKENVIELQRLSNVYSIVNNSIISTIDKEKFNIHLDTAKETEYKKTVKFLEMANDFLSFGDLYQLQRAVGNHRCLVENGIIKVNNSYFRA